MSYALNLCEPGYPATDPHSEIAMESYIQVHGVGPALSLCHASSHLTAPTFSASSVYRELSPDAHFLLSIPHGLVALSSHSLLVHRSCT
jgi:hypothetical protein